MKLLDELCGFVKSRHGAWGERWDWARGKVEALSPEERAEFLAACVARFPRGVLDRGTVEYNLAHCLLTLTAAADPAGALSEERAAALEALSRQQGYWQQMRHELLAEADLAVGRPLSPALIAVFRRAATDTYTLPQTTAFARKLTEPLLNVGEPWAERAMADAEARGEPWRRLLAHVLTATAAKPNDKWNRPARELIAEIGADAVLPVVLEWLALVGRPRTFLLDPNPYGPDGNESYDPFNANAVRGLTWLVALLPADPASARTLGALVETSLRKAAGIGPRNPKVANACVVALTLMDGEAVLAELARLATRVTFKGTLKILDAALEAKAEALGLSREEIEELAVPAYGLTEVGRAVVELGETKAVLAVVGPKAVLSWRSAAGKPVKSVPAAVKRDHAEELKELKASAKDLDKMLTAQAERLDRQFLARRTWAFGTWRERYLDHPLVGTLARRLLWTVDGISCGYADGELRDLAGNPVPPGEVALWHPIGKETTEVLAWREWLERHGITQPFKQAHREVYLLTDAERNTRVYSNRFAAHVLRQHQFHSLTAIRGWRNKLRLMVDDTYPPATRDLPHWGLRAEYWVQGDGEDYGGDTTESGSYLRLRTDQVRFYPIDAPESHAHAWANDNYTTPEGVEPVPLADVPALVLSEVLRDVDLFVGVASVGNDPTWQDGGPDGRFREYWTTYGFGELGETAQTRRDLLTRLVPRLAIGGQCVVEDRFLHVKGTRHTYKIHLGSGNIMIEPDNRYLCIVPKSATTDAYLPFEGDRTLAVILSKALLLAKDTEITDPTILSQL
ncbi:DUF4132 domain-containing protein [Umezawaea sp. NPDC059074]|uniref:DUF4132 domain-containing protein n=1 Tax=Umezawaea sp. NPDC059074 TaxID=3346716 RepID=UPI0036951EDE